MKTLSLNFIKRALVAVAMTAFLSGCLTQPNASNMTDAPKDMTPAIIPAAAPQVYTLQVGDVLDVKVLLNPELNEQTVVRPDGLISTSLARDVQAFGKTPGELQADMEGIYKTQLINPKVSVIVRSFAPTRVYVLGEVNTPGEFITVGPTLTLLQAISRAGGVKNSAGTDKIVIVRRGASEKPTAIAANYMSAVSGKDPAADVRLAPYDVVYVPRSDVGDAYLYFQQYVAQFVPVSFGANYQVGRDATVR